MDEVKGSWWRAARPHLAWLGVGAAWTALGLAFLAVGAGVVARGPGNIPAELRAEAEGVVTGMATTDRRYWQLQVRYPGPGGEDVAASVVQRRDRGTPSPSLGEKVPVVYSVLEPERAFVRGHSFNRLLLLVPAAFTLAGAALLGVGVRRARRGRGIPDSLDRIGSGS